MRVNALVVDLALLGPGRLGLPRAARRRAAGAGRRRLHRPLERRPARARPAARRRRLGHQALPPRGGARARRGRGPPAQAGVGRESRPGRSWRASSRSAPTSSRRSPRGRSVDLTRREFEVLQLLAQAEGKVLQREEIYQAVWGYAMAHGDRSVDVFVRKVRQKLETASPDWSYIHTHFGVGYRFDPERPGDAEPDVLEAARTGPRPGCSRRGPRVAGRRGPRARGRPLVSGAISDALRTRVSRLPYFAAAMSESAHRADRRGPGRRRGRVPDREPGRRRRRRAGRADHADADGDRDGAEEAATEPRPRPSRPRRRSRPSPASASRAARWSAARSDRGHQGRPGADRRERATRRTSSTSTATTSRENVGAGQARALPVQGRSSRACSSWRATWPRTPARTR